VTYPANVPSQTAANYHALVFLGLAEAQLSHYPQAQLAHEKAIDINPLLPLAHQGLLKLLLDSPKISLLL
jgi:hypothetical protein